MAIDTELRVQYIWSSGKSEGKNFSKMVKALPTNPQKWPMLDVSDLRNGRWYINFALFSLGTALILPGERCKSKRLGIQKDSCVCHG